MPSRLTPLGHVGSGTLVTLDPVAQALPTVAPSPIAVSVADQYFIPAIAGLFVLIIIVAIVLALLMLRKK